MDMFESGQAGMERAVRGVTEALRKNGGFLEQMDLAFRSCDSSAGTLTLTLEPKDWMANPMGVMHGGLVAGALDTAMGTLSSYAAGGTARTPTVTMSVSYLRPVPLDRTVCVRARMVSAGRTLNHLAAELWADGEEGRVLATAVGDFFALRR